MNKLKKSAVKREFTYMRSLIRDAEKSMSKNFDNECEVREQIANELVAAANIFSQWVLEQE